MNCPHCQQNIPDKAIKLHMIICARKHAGEGAGIVEGIVEGIVVAGGSGRPPVASTPAPPAPIIEHGASAVKTEPIAPVTDVSGDVREVVMDNHTSPEVTTTLTAEAPSPKTNGNGNSEVFYPTLDPYFMVSGDIAEALRVTHELSKKHPTNLLITGQPGGGKTSLAIQFAAKYHRPIIVADFGVLQEPQQLFQTTRLIEQNGNVVTDTRESGFVRGIETPNCVVVMDELTRVENERCLNPLMPILDGRKNAWIDDLRRRIHVADGVVFIATINEGSMFCGISSLDAALRDRFREVFMDYMPARAEAEVLMKKTGVPEAIAFSLAEFAGIVRRTPAISRKISTRQMLHAAEAWGCGTALWQAVETALGNYSDPVWRQQCMEIMSLNFKDEAELAKWQNRQDGDSYAQYI